MSNPASANSQIGTSGNARSYGIPSLATQFTGTSSGSAQTLNVLASYDKAVAAAIQQGVDNNNEFVNWNRTQRALSVKFSAVASGTSISAAAAIGNDLPIKGDLINVGHMTAGAFVSGSATGAASSTALDPMIETATAYCEDASTKRTPEGALIIEISATIYYNPDGSFKVLAALT